MDIDVDRLRADIEANAEFGALEVESGHGRTAFCATPANRDARRYLVERLEDAGLEVRIDAVGNIAGRWVPGRADPAAAAVASGSHLDSVRAGGIFDGPLGVYAALEAVRGMQDAGLEPVRPVEVVSFTEEEGGRFGPGLLGSSVATGVRDVDEALALVDDEGVSLADGLETVGFRGEGRLAAEAWDSWVELHVEQGERLEAAGVPVGVVTTIAGITHSTVELRGTTDHAGATPMDRRRDALCAAAEVVLAVEEAATGAASGTAVGTVGQAVVDPNVTNVVPGGVTLGLDVRDADPAGIEAVHAVVRDRLDEIESSRGVETEVDRRLDVAPTPMSDRIWAAARAAAESIGVEAMALHSGAAHDSMHVARVTDAGMLFAPSRDGISHSPEEWTAWSDCAAATRVLGATLADLAGAS